MFTPKYIKMCSEAKEIQEGWKPELGDRGCSIKGELGIVTNHVSFFYALQLLKAQQDGTKNIVIGVGNVTFLPLQHQLQEMTLRGVGCLAKMYGFYEEFMVCNEAYADSFESIDELWLAYIMLFEYQKKWNNTKEVWK